jgi:hypothetical protein
MTRLDEIYQLRDHSRLAIGAAALDEIEARYANDGGDPSPRRTAMGEILNELSEEYSHYHKSVSACRAYLRDSVRVVRFFTPDRVEELKPYNLKFSHMLACITRGEYWPECDETATQELLNWAIEKHASPADIWDHRATGDKLSPIDKAWNRILSAMEKYQDVTTTEPGEVVEKRRQLIREFMKGCPPAGNANR